MPSELISCPGCGANFRNFADITGQNGEVYACGLVIYAECPACKCEFAVNRHYRAMSRIVFEPGRQESPGRKKQP